MAVVPQKSTRGRVTPQIQSSILGTAAVSCTGTCSSQPWATHLPGPGGQFLDLFTPCGSQPTVEHHLPYLEVFGVEKNKNKTKKTGRSHHGQRKQQPLVPLAPNHFSHHAPGQRPPRVLCRSKFSSEDPFSVMSVSWFSPKPLQDVKTQTSLNQPGKEF